MNTEKMADLRRSLEHHFFLKTSSITTREDGLLRHARDVHSTARVKICARPVGLKR